MDKLGPTLAAIAGEKAGIVKPGRPVVTGRLPAEAAEVVATRASEVSAPLAVLGKDFDVEVRGEPTLLGVGVRVRDGDLDVEATLGVAGRHQAENAALALACVRRLGVYAPATLAAAARRGLPRVVLPGRIEVLGEHPWLLVDAAHTERSAAALADTLVHVPRRKTRLVLSISSDKRLEPILARLLPLADEVFVTRAEPLRSLDPAQVARAIRAAAPRLLLHAVPNPFLAVRAACEGLGAGDLLLATGSIYLAGIARRILRERSQ
jgi:dihydrofolate synthase/folylpolyglutamate synthase